MSNNALVLSTQTYDAIAVAKTIEDFNSWFTRSQIDTYTFKLVDLSKKFTIPAHDRILLLEDDPFTLELQSMLSALGISNKDIYLI